MVSVSQPKILRRFGLALVVAVALAATTPASGQAVPDLDDLEQQALDLQAEIDDTRAEIGSINDAIETAATDAVVATVSVELLANELEEAVDRYREPAQTRIDIALFGFTQGDPRQSALLDEVLALQGSDEEARARQLYTAVIEDAQARLEVATADVEEASEALNEALAEQTAALDNEQSLIDERTALRQRRDQLRQELDDLGTEIERVRELQTTATLTGETVPQAVTRPALVVKIDNVPAARPQSGINQADIVYTILVEGSLTRLGAVFHSQTPSQVGPIRSMRTSDFDLFAPYNSPLYSNSGGNRITRELLEGSSLVDVGAASNFSLYFRSASRPAPHNLYTNPANIWSVARGDDYPTGTPEAMFTYRAASAAPSGSNVSEATSVTADYGATSVTYRWNGSGWNRSQDGGATVDTSGVQASPTNVIVQFTPYGVSVADPASPEALTVGQGDAWIFSDGQISIGQWQRDSANDIVRYIDSNGDELDLLPGQTWIELPRPGDASWN